MNTIRGLFILALASAGAIPAQENYSLWAKYRNLTLNTTNAGGGANTAGHSIGFPVLVRLSAAQADVFAQSQANGADIRFTKADGTTRLAHEIESWDAAGQSAAIWVRLDTAYGNNSTQSVRLYWGNAGAPDSSKGSSVFRTADKYQGVWHFATLNDATANGNNGANTATTDTSGPIGRARHFNGTSAYITIPNSATMNSSQPFTIEGWVNWQGIGTGATDRYRPMMTHGSSGSNGNQVFLQPRRPTSGGTDPYYSFGYYTGSNQTSVTNDARIPAVSDSGAWVHISAAYDGTSWILYRNGVLGATTTRTATVANATTNWFLGGGDGNGATTPSRFHFGRLDEMRFSDAARDSNWARLSYETQKPGATAWTVGATQTNTVSSPPTGLDYSSDTAAYPFGVAIVPNTATVTGFVDSFTVSPSLPQGLLLNKSTGAITGVPSVLTAATTYVVSAVNSLGSARDTLRLSVISVPPTGLTYPSTAAYLAGVSIEPLVASVNGSVDSFTVSPSLPAGLVLDKATGTVTGTPLAVAAATAYVITARNPSGTASATVTITITAENYATWAKRRTVRLNTSASGANVFGTVLGFPVLLRLDSAALSGAQVAANGSDLRFTKPDNATLLPHQVDSWDTATRRGTVWVLVDTVLGGNALQSFRMHWGKTGAPDLSRPAAVFDTSRGFQAVWHFAPAPGDSVRDATANGFTAAPQRTSGTLGFPADVDGPIGRAREFGVGATSNAMGSYYTVPNSAAGRLDFPQNSAFTASTWAYTDTLGVSSTLFSKSDKQYSMELRQTGAEWEFSEFQGGTGWHAVNEPATARTWTHLVGVRTGALEYLYVNGVLVDSEIRVDASSAARRQVDFNIGRSPDGGSSNAARYYFNGRLDELRLANRARDLHWIRLEHENQKPGQTLVTFTDSGSASVMSARRAPSAASLAAKSSGGSVVFAVETAGAASARIELCDMSGRAVWSAVLAPGARRIAWNGKGLSGAPVSAGLYLARMKLLDAQGRSLGVVEAKVPFTP